MSRPERARTPSLRIHPECFNHFSYQGWFCEWIYTYIYNIYIFISEKSVDCHKFVQSLFCPTRNYQGSALTLCERKRHGGFHSQMVSKCEKRFIVMSSSWICGIFHFWNRINTIPPISLCGYPCDVAALPVPMSSCEGQERGRRSALGSPHGPQSYIPHLIQHCWLSPQHGSEPCWCLDAVPGTRNHPERSKLCRICFGVTKPIVIFLIFHNCQKHCSLETKDRHFDNYVVIGGIVNCHYDNLRCHQPRQSCQNDNPLFSVFTYSIKHSYLTAVTAAQLQWHLSNMNAIQQMQPVLLQNSKLSQTDESTNGTWVSSTPLECTGYAVHPNHCRPMTHKHYDRPNLIRRQAYWTIHTNLKPNWFICVVVFILIPVPVVT